MKLVVMSYINAVSTQVIGAIHEQHPIDAIVRVEWQPRPRTAARFNRLSQSPVAQLQQAIDRRVGNWQHRRLIERVSNIFAGHRKNLPDVPTYTVGSRELHEPDSLEMFASLNPDVLLLSHAPLLKPALFQLPKLATLNVHWGIAPDYCGDHTLFWPLYFRDYAKIGVTIHRIDEGIDTGPILAQGFPGLFPYDDEATLMARCADLASELACNVLEAAQAGDPLIGMQPKAPSRLFLTRDRQALQTLRYWARRRLWQEKLPALEARRQLYFHPVAPRSLARV